MTIVPDRTAFLSAARPGVRFPVVQTLPLERHSALELFRRVRTNAHCVLLESGKRGRYSYIASAGALISSTDSDADPFATLRRALAAPVVAHPDLLGFCGGAVGYLAYDVARRLENIPTIAQDDLSLPEICFLLVESFYELDHDEQVIRIVHAPLLTDGPASRQYDGIIAHLESMARAIAHVGASPDAGSHDANARASNPAPRTLSLTQEMFEEIVTRARAYIRAGDIFQVNLSMRIDEPFGDDPLELYETLREINPAPYMAFLELPGQSIVSASPELLLSVRGRRIETRPIAGTRARGASDVEDEANASELITNEKERAEHLMLVDLERNDLGRVARYGSVEVDEFMAIERYSHVIHIVSNVRAELADGRDTFDAIAACFPGGTITGAPKVRAMEIIEELEPARRGIYTGSIGWIGFDGNAELNIAIRTILIARGVAHVQAGAGIVADSVPAHEFRESMRKAEAGLEALRRTRERLARRASTEPQSEDT